MAYSTPPTFLSGNLLTSAQLNLYLRDNFRALSGQDGPITLFDSVQIYVASTAPNATAAIFGGHSGNTSSSAIWFQRNAAAAGGRFLILTRTDANVLTEALRVDQNQRVGVGTTDPLARLHLRDGSTPVNAAFWANGGINGTAQTILPTSTGATVVGVMGMCAGTGTLIPQLQSNLGMNTTTNTALLFSGNSATDVVTLTLASGGLTVRRTAGSDTYRASLWVFWA